MSVESRDPNFQPGDVVTGYDGWQQYAASPGKVKLAKFFEAAETKKRLISPARELGGWGGA